MSERRNFRIELVVADRNWILEEFASRILAEAAATGNECAVVDAPSGAADLYYFLPYSVFRRVDGAVCGALFTHVEEDFPEAKARFFEVARECDFCVCMSSRYEARLREAGVHNVSTIMPGVDQARFFPKLRIGVVGRAYHTGRKNEAMVARLRRLPFVELRFTGSGWPGRSVHCSDSKLNDFYNDIDYLLVTAKIEGGPMPLLEAVAAGTPVIAPDVGFVPDFPHIPYQNSSVEDLAGVLLRLYEERCRLAKGIDGASWQAFGSAHHVLFAGMLEQTAQGSGNSLAGQPPLSAILVTHGSESQTKGGPSQRVAYTVDLLRQLSVSASHAYGLDGDMRGARIVHVFNSWPLSSSLKTIRSYKRRGAAVAFSPIMLDLSFMPEYVALSRSSSRNEVRQLLARYSSSVQKHLHGGAGPMETVPDQFRTIRESCELADVVIALSERERADLTAIGVEASRIRVVKNCVDPAFLEPSPVDRSFADRIGVQRYFLVVGRVEARKNLLAICEALSDLGVPVVSIGAAPDAAYKQAIERLYGGSVIFIDRLEDKALLASAYSCCSAYVQFSWSEGASLSTLEAFACGAPLLIAPTSGEREYFDGQATFVEPFDLDGLASAAANLLASGHDNDAARAERLPALKQDTVDYAEATVSAYRDALQHTEATPPGVVYVDITSYAHSVFNRQTSTGGIALERKMLEAYRVSRHDVVFLVWCHRGDRFYQLPRDRVTDADLAGFLSAGGWPEAGTTSYFHKLGPADPANSQDNEPPAVEVDPEHVRHLLTKLDNARLGNEGGAFLLMQLLKACIRSLPPAIRKAVVSLIVKRKPTFDLRSSLPSRTGLGSGQAGSSGTGAASATTMRIHSTADEGLLPGARLVNIGNAWLSNARYLDTLQNLVARYRLDLRAIVYDLLPITHRQFFPSSSADKFEQHLKTIAGFASTLYAISEYSLAALSSYLRLNGLRPRADMIEMGSTRHHCAPEAVPNLPARYVLCVSSVNLRKNHAFLLRVWGELIAKRADAMGDVQLVLVGKNTFKDTTLQSSPNTIHYDHVSDGQLVTFYENCLFTVYPSIAEGFGLPVVESIEYGKPCIASDLPSLSSVRHPAVLKVPADDFFGWLEAISTLVRNTIVRQALTEECADFQVGATWAESIDKMTEERMPTKSGVRREGSCEGSAAHQVIGPAVASA